MKFAYLKAITIFTAVTIKHSFENQFEKILYNHWLAITDDIVYELNILGGQLGGSQRDLIFEVVKKHIQ